jgi:hypothetical protein
MKFNDYQHACDKEAQRLHIAEQWARIHTPGLREFDQGRFDRLTGNPCRSANGSYLDGWYSVRNEYKA